MRLVLSDKTKRVIKGQQEIRFSSFSSFHLIKLTVRAKDLKQLEPGSSDDEDLTFTLDGRKFPKLNTKNDVINSPAAFSGGSIIDPTIGATNYYSTPIDKVPYWATKERERIIVDNLHFYQL